MNTVQFDSLYFKDVDGDGRIQIAGGIDQVFDRELGIELSSSQAIRDYPGLNQTLYLENPEDNLEVQLGFAPGAPMGYLNAPMKRSPITTQSRTIRPGPVGFGLIILGVIALVGKACQFERAPQVPIDPQIYHIVPSVDRNLLSQKSVEELIRMADSGEDVGAVIEELERRASEGDKGARDALDYLSMPLSLRVSIGPRVW